MFGSKSTNVYLSQILGKYFLNLSFQKNLTITIKKKRLKTSMARLTIHFVAVTYSKIFFVIGIPSYYEIGIYEHIIALGKSLC